MTILNRASPTGQQRHSRYNFFQSFLALLIQVTGLFLDRSRVVSKPPANFQDHCIEKVTQYRQSFQGFGRYHLLQHTFRKPSRSSTRANFLPSKKVVCKSSYWQRAVALLCHKHNPKNESVYPSYFSTVRRTTPHQDC